MAATKRLHAEEEANGAPDLVKPSKKQKVKEAIAAGDEDAAALKKQKKKEKKAKKEAAAAEAAEGSEEKSEEQKKEEKKKRKEEKREKKRLQEEAAAAAAGGEDVAMTEAASEEAVAEEPSKKKEKKDKKKKSKSSSEEVRSTITAAAPAASADGIYKQTASLTALPESDIDAFFSEHSIVVDDTKTDKAAALRPVIAFSHLPSTDLLSKSPFTAYKTPTPIQAASWPWTLSGRDAIGVAETGSGKTMAFALPLVEKLCRMAKGKKPQRGIKAVVVSPTRELAMQTHEQTAQLASLVGLKCVCVYGGSPKEEQRALIQRGADIIVATPGRLKDFMSDGTVMLEGARFAVLDEADRMLDKGFEDDIKAILGAMPPREERQTLMFTATWPTSVRVLASTFMVDPVKITIGRPVENDAGAEQLQANSRITQRVEVLDGRDKERRLLQILKQYQAKGKNDRMLVFCLYKKEATRVEGFLQQRGISVCGIHGDLRQEQRTRSLEAFKSGQTPVLVATDVAARGLDIPEVKLVINVTFPLTIEDYVHRIGRTGRAGKTGEAITFFTQQDKAHSGALINILKGANQPVPDELFKFGTTVKKKAHDTYGAFFKDVDMSKKATKITFD